MSEDRRGLRLIVFMVVAASLGFLAITVPSCVGAGLPGVAGGCPFLRIMSYAVEHLQFLQSAVLLLVISMVLGFMHPRQWWLLGMCMIIPFPVSMLIEIFIVPRSHNLWPIEMLVYGVLLLPALIGNLLGVVLRKRWETFRAKKARGVTARGVTPSRASGSTRR